MGLGTSSNVRRFIAVATIMVGCSGAEPAPVSDMGPDGGGCVGPDADGDGVPDVCDVCAGGDDNRDVNGDGTPDECECIGAMCTCADAANPVTYYLDSLTIPTPEMALAGELVGYDLDGVDEACAIRDWDNRVDNMFIDIIEAISRDVDVQADIDAGLCLDGGQLGIDLVFQVATGQGCATVDVYSGGSSGTLVGSFIATDNGGVLRGRADSLSLQVPHGPSASEWSLPLTRVELSATIGANGLTDVLLGGVLSSSAFQMFAETLAEPFACEAGCGTRPPGEPFVCIPAECGVLGLLDLVNPTNGFCDADGFMSVGLLATASTSPISAACVPAMP